MVIVGVVVAIACWSLVLWNAYRRSSDRYKKKGLIVTVGWVILVTPIAAYRLGNNIIAMGAVAAAGALLFGVLSWKRGFDVIEQDRKERAEAANKPMGKAEWGCLIVVVGSITLLFTIIFLH